MKNICNICSAKNTELFKKADKYQVLNCKKCHNYFIYPFPSKKEVDSLYAEDSFNNAAYYSRCEVSNLSTFEKRIALIQKITKLKEGKILDYGCSTGNFMDVAKKHKYSVMGKELNKKCIQICRKKGLNVSPSIQEKDFNLIYAGDILEHMEYPNKFIMELSSHLKKGGFLVIATPDFNNFVTRLIQIKPEEHLFYYTQDGAKYLLKNNGFEILYLKGCKRDRSAEALFFSETTKKSKFVKFVLNLTKTLKLQKLIEIFISNIEDDMLIIAKKI